MKHRDCEQSFPHKAHEFINVNDMGCLAKCEGFTPTRADREGDAQPLPIASDAPIAHRLVQADLEDRLALGISRYGQPLQAHNGRDSLRDAYDEALDLCVYLRNAIYERDNPK